MKEGEPGGLEATEHHICIGEDHGIDPSGIHVKAHEGRAADLRQSEWFHQGKVMPDQSGGLL